MASTFQSLPIFFQSLSARARISSSNPPRSHSSESVSENAPWSICRPSSVAVNTASSTRAGKLSPVCRQESSSSEPNSIAIACCGRVSCLGYVLSFIIVCAWGRQLYVTTTGGSSGGNLPTPCGQDCASPVILLPHFLCRARAKFGKAEAQSEPPKNFAPRPCAWNSQQKSRAD